MGWPCTGMGWATIDVAVRRVPLKRNALNTHSTQLRVRRLLQVRLTFLVHAP